MVIDVLRATSVIASALEAGAARLLTCREVDEAMELAGRMTPRPLLCGERGCKPIPGFDLGNSPAEYTAERVRGQTLVLTTTNGTRAVEAAASAARVIAASFLNLSAVLDKLAGCASIHLVCAGTEGEITAEDAALAGAILCGCQRRYHAELRDDESVLARQLWRSWFPGDGREELASTEQLSHHLRETRGARNLLRLGYEEDLRRCAAIDRVRAVPERISNQPATFA